MARLVKKVLARRSQRSRAQAVSSRDWWAWRERHPVRLRQVAFVGFHRVRDMPSQLAGLCAQGPAGDAQQEGGRGLLPAGLPQDAGQQQPIELPGRSRRSLLPPRRANDIGAKIPAPITFVPQT